MTGLHGGGEREGGDVEYVVAALLDQQGVQGPERAAFAGQHEVQRARYDATRAERRYLAVDAENRLVARGLETAWEEGPDRAGRREAQRPKALTTEQQNRILALGSDLDVVFSAPTTTDRDRKELLATLLTEVTVSVDRSADRADLMLRWKGGAITDLTVPLIARKQDRLRTDEGTIDLVRRLASHYPDAQIAGILNRQNRSTATGLPFTAGRVQSLRHHWNIDAHQSDPTSDIGETGTELFTIVDAAEELRLPPSTLHRWIQDGFIDAEQITTGAPGRIRLTDQVRALFVDEAPEGWLAMLEATLAHGVSRKTIMKNIKTGDLQAVYIRTGRRKGLRIDHQHPRKGCFNHDNQKGRSMNKHPTPPSGPRPAPTPATGCARSTWNRWRRSRRDSHGPGGSHRTSARTVPPIRVPARRRPAPGGRGQRRRECRAGATFRWPSG